LRSDTHIVGQLRAETGQPFTTASLLVVGIAAVAGAVAHARAGRVRLREGAVFGVLGIAGSYLGSRASAAVPANVLLAGFGLMMLAVAAAMITRRRPGPPACRPGHDDGREPLLPGKARPMRPDGAWALRGGRHPLLVAAAATEVGLITGFFGVGGGSVVVAALVLILGFDMAAAAGTSLVIAIDSAAALASRAGHGGLPVDWALTGGFTVAAVASVLLGGRLAGRASPQLLSAAFTVLIVAVAGYTLARTLPGLT
jgi:uncharacterized protein